MSDWLQICTLEDIPRLGSRVVQRISGGDIAIFRTAEDEVFALHDKCPHKGGPLSQGIVHGKRVTCPMHGWNIQLDNGEAVAPDVGGCNKFDVKVDAGKVFLKV
ncbi:MAG: nitrite reductase small subunit NirD [Zoogloeaceae bacterium]|nr:nitrite reductase small subunit NirD [Zoogloeaceae bacterium]